MWGKREETIAVAPAKWQGHRFNSDDRDGAAPQLLMRAGAGPGSSQFRAPGCYPSVCLVSPAHCRLLFALSYLSVPCRQFSTSIRLYLICESGFCFSHWTLGAWGQRGLGYNCLLT